MSPAQKRLRELLDKQSHDRQRAIELSKADALTDETRAELDAIETRAADTERQLRAARLAVEDEDAAATVDKGDSAPDAEQRARIELRSRASLGLYLRAALNGRSVTGAEAELQQAAGVDGIPIELWQVPRPDAEHRAISPAPGTVGVNLDVLRPAVFAPSIADKLSIEMPQVESGTYATGTITTSATADAVAKSAEVPQSAAAFAVGTTTPHRIGASLGLTLEDIAAVGQANFESVLRENVSLVLSDHLDDMMINGDTATDANELEGIFKRLTDPTDPTAVADFDTFAAAHAGGIDGLWANTLTDVVIVCGPDTMKLSARTFQSATNYKGELSAAAYAMANTGGWWTNKRMPDTASTIQHAILCRKGRPGMRLAVCPHWGYISIDDIYTGARKGERHFTVSVLVGDVILVQPDAYAQVAYKVA